MKNHIENNGKVLRGELKTKFGDLLSLRDKLINTSNPSGQIEAAKDLSRQQLEAETYLEYSPVIKNAIQKIIDGTTQYNVDEADFLKSASINSNKINKAQADVDLAGVNFKNQKHIQGLNYINELEYGKQVQEATLVQMNIQHQMRTAFHAVDALSRLQQMRLQPAAKQRDVDIAFQKTLISENLKYGDRANEAYHVRKNYLSASSEEPLNLPQVISNLASKLGIYI